MVLDNRCAAGEKRFQELDPAQFKPRDDAGVNVSQSATWKRCHLCNQMTLVKLNGFFVTHNESQAADYPSQTHGRSGNPARVRRRQG